MIDALLAFVMAPPVVRPEAVVAEVRYRQRRARSRAPVVDLNGCCWPALEAARTKSVRIITDGEGRWIVREQVRPGIEGFYDIFPAFKEDTK